MPTRVDARGGRPQGRWSRRRRDDRRHRRSPAPWKGGLARRRGGTDHARRSLAGAERRRVPQAAWRAPPGPPGPGRRRRPGHLPGQLRVRRRDGGVPHRQRRQARRRRRRRRGRVRGRRRRGAQPHGLERGRARPGRRGVGPCRAGAPAPAAAVPVGARREGPVRPGPSGLDHRPADRHPRRPAVHLVGLTGDPPGAAAMTAERTGGGGRARRHRLVAGFVVAYLAAGGVTLALGDRVTGGAWLALHLVLLGAITNAIVVWSEQFAAALLRTAPVGERAATARALVLNLGVLAVLGGVHAGRPVFTAAGAWLVGAVVLAHAVVLAARTGRALAARLAETVWFYVAASAALLAAMGLGVLLAGGAASSGDAYRAMRLAHVHLGVLGWVGLAVVGTLFTLWPTVLRTRMVPGLERAVRWSLPALVAGLVVATAGLLWQARVVALAGLAGY